MKKVPQSLRNWFIAHFIIDYIFGIPLLLFPTWTLQLFGFPAVEVFTARLLGAGLIGTGGVSLFERNGSVDRYQGLLTFKILWAIAALVGILLTIIVGAPPLAWLAVALFAVFLTAWIYYKRVLGGRK